MDRSVNSKKSIVTGIFLGIGIVVISLSFYLSSSYLSFLDSRFALFTQLYQVQGIGPGSQVALNGMTIGNVERVEISPENIQQVKVLMKIDQKFLNRIPKDSSIELKTQGALGDKYLQIRPGTSLETLKPGDFIQARHSKDLLDLISEKGEEAQNLFQLITEAVTLIKHINQQDKITNILENTEIASREIRKLSQELRELIQSFKQQERQEIQTTLKNLARITEKIEKGHGTLGALINDPSLHHSLKKILVKNDDRNVVDSLFLKNLMSHPQGP
ncbi:MAG: MlaD family protein [Bdellovibrionaceae bacterium]|nr:MlaD family protein [Pseudobdellovibrionaceae bacterium]MDW8190557.1 MlaD family protein [Pseudobdellovibrionaceae bacterium]